MGGYNRYTEEQIKFIQENAGKMHPESIALEIGSTEAGIKTYISRNNLGPDYRVVIEKVKPKIVRPAAEYSNQDWSKY
jgi:hypothetical protein